jgi:hypothetical protein
MMSVGAFQAQVHLPVGAVSRHDSRGREIVQQLPPYALAQVHRVDDCMNAPLSWQRSSSDVSVYVVGVKEGDGMWLYFDPSSRLDRHFAVIANMQGINAITCLPASDTTLVQYRHRCPVHETPFMGSNRFCGDCGFEWPAQSYIASASNAPRWIDGFRVTGANGRPSGEVRQFLFTSDTSRGVAANLIGNDRTFNLKFSFFEGPQKPRPTYRGGVSYSLDSCCSKGGGLESFGTRSRGITPEISGRRLNQPKHRR